jgi:UDP-glucose 4-epimerase
MQRQEGSIRSLEGRDLRNRIALVTGAFGFIGRNVARVLASRGWKVIGLGHGVWSRQEWQAWGIEEWHTCDVTIDSLLTYANDPDILVHCAGSGSVGFSMTHPLQDYQRTVQTTLNVLEFMRLHSPKIRFVYPSSVAVYGNAESLPITEITPLNPVSPYGFHKKIAEDLCISYARNFGAAIAIVRLFSVYGRHLRKQLLWDACTKISRGDYTFFGSGLEKRDWLHINDAAELLLHSYDYASQKPAICNGASGVGVTVRDLLGEVFSCFGLDDEPRFSASLREGDPPKYVGNNEKARSWGWQPKTDWKEGVRDYVQWFMEGAK